MRVMPTITWSRLGSSLLWAIALTGCGTLPAAPVEHKSDSHLAESDLVQSLQRQVRERDRRIAELTSQLEALKVIDQEVDERRKSIKPPATLTPTATDQGR